MLRDKLGNARSSKKDEFYTLYTDVKFELDHYLDQFKDKTIYCPCDTEDSAFVKYFSELKAKGLIEDLIYTSLQDGVDFLSEAAVEIYRHADIVVTNPPFSLFRQFIELLDSLDKKFIVWSTNNAIMYRNVARLLVQDKIRLGYIKNKTCEFEVPKSYFDFEGSKAYTRGNSFYCKVASVCVFTNLSVALDNVISLSRQYDNTYVRYDNFDAINVNSVKDIPIDYYGYIGVPVTYLAKHDPSKFRIVGIFNNFRECDYSSGYLCGEMVDLNKPPFKTRGPVINGQPIYARLIIQRI